MKPAPAKHEHVRQWLHADLTALSPHTCLPTERDLAFRYAVSRATVRQALRALEYAGMVYRIQGSGTFVADVTTPKSLALASFSQDMRSRGLRPGSRIIAADEIVAGAVNAEQLQVDTGDAVVRLTRLRLADESPMCLETVYLASARVPGLLEHDLTGSLYGLLEDCYGIVLARADQSVQARSADGADAALLGLAPGAPALAVRRVGFDHRERPVERTTSLYRPDRYEIRFAVRRDPFGVA